MTKEQIERKIRYLGRNIQYYCRVYPGSRKIPLLKSKYRYYRKMLRELSVNKIT